MRNMSYKRILSVIISVALIISCFFSASLGDMSSVYADGVTGYVKSGTVGLRVRESPDGAQLKDSAGNNIFINGDTRLVVLDTTNSAWYKVQLSYNGTTVTGYVSSSYVVIDSQSSSGESTGGSSGALSDAEFEAYMTAQGFPESYKPYLRTLHEQHPTWTFIAVQTGIDWNTLIENERSKSGQVKNLVQGTTSAPHYNWRSTEVGYNWSTDKWSSYDGSTWFAASDEILAYYLDPRTYLYEAWIFSFEALSYQDGIHNRQGVEAILKGSFMYDSCPAGETRKYSEIIMEAAKTYDISPYHLASRMRQEMGTTAGTAALGTHSTYPGIFNFFNIGAYDSAAGNAVTNGLKWAATSGSYGRPWNSAYKAIMGGAQYLAQSYINKGQDTLYTQKFNVTNTASLFSHQYMTNIQAPANEGNTVYRAYLSNGIIDSSLAFEIPVYKNMPSSAVAKPADSGNPNNWLKSLNVSGYTLTPSFSVSETTEYSLIVGGDVGSVNISATTVNANARISGTGTVNLSEGTNTVNITVTAQNGDVRTYKLTIVRGSASSGGNTGGAASGGNASDKVNAGDLNGDGKITALDIVKIQRLIVGLDSLTAESLALGDINGDGKITALDIVKVQRHIVGLETIKW